MKKLALSTSVIAIAAALALGPTALAQEAPPEAIVTQELPAPAVADLTAPSEREGQFVEVNGARIFYQSGGEGPPMLLLHGYPLSGALFARVRQVLEEDYQVITVDHRGYGLSEAPGTPDTIATYAEDTLAVMDELGLEQAIVGGMSMGGPIAFEMYSRAPERFSGLILIDTIAAAASPAEAGLWRGIAEMVEQNGVAAIIPALIPDMLTGETRVSDEAVVEYLVSVMQGASVEAAIGGAIALAERPGYADLLGEIDVPTLILVGLADAVYPVAVSRRMNEAIPNSTLAIIPGGSHAAIFEAPERSAAAISNWAANMGQGSTAETEQMSEAAQSESMSAAPTDGMAAMVEASGTTYHGNTITVPSVVLPEAGFAAVHAMTDGQPIVPASIGHTMVQAGQSDNVMIELEYPPAPGEDYMVMLHADTDGNGQYDFGEGSTDVDTPITRDGSIVMQSFTAQ